MAKDQKNMLVLNRNFTLNTTSGHSVRFVKNVPVFVPPAVYKQAIAIGATPADGSDPDVLDSEVVNLAPTDPRERGAKIMDSIKKLVAENDRESFTASGSPKVDAISTDVGFKVQAREITDVWQQYREEVTAANMQDKEDATTATEQAAE